jgi:hypothetical protein
MSPPYKSPLVYNRTGLQRSIDRGKINPSSSLNSLTASQHVVDQGPVAVVAIRTDMIEDRVVVRRYVSVIDQFFCDYEFVTGIANLKRSAHQGNGSHCRRARVFS